MHTIFRLSFIILFLFFGVTILPSPLFATHLDQNSFLQCGEAYTNGVYDRDDVKQCSVNGQVRDASGNIISGGKVFLYYNDASYNGVIHDAGKVEIPVGSGGYSFCSVKKSTTPLSSINYPVVDRISFWAPGYIESQTYSLNTSDPCKTGNTPLGGSPPLQKATSRIGCFVQNGQPSCVDKSSNPQGQDQGAEFQDQNSCRADCGLWYIWVVPNRTDIQPQCDTEAPSGDFERKDSITYYLKSKCVNDLNADTSIGGVTGTPTPTPSPTPLPPHPPCMIPYFNDDDEFVGCGAVSTGLGVPISTDPANFVKSIFQILLGISGGIAILLIIRAGYKFMTSQGDPERVKEAREILTSAIIGLLFLIFSLVILEVIGVDLLGIPGINR